MGVHGPRRALLIPHRNNYRAAVLADSPSAYWRLGEASGTSAADASGNTNTGVYTGGVTLGQPGALAAEPNGTGNAAALFDGTDDHVTTTYSHDFSDTAPFSITGWLNPTAVDASFRAFAGQLWSNGSGQQGVTCWVHSISGIGIERWLNNASDSLMVSTSFLPVGAWTHLAFTYDGTNLRTYVNGVLRGGPTASAKSLAASTATFRIGHDNVLSRTKGNLDEVAVYPTALSAARVQAHYSASGRGR